ncbi:MAG: S41 family peptidase [Pseudomonadota bacterium]
MKSWLAGVGAGAVLGVGLVGISAVAWPDVNREDPRAEVFGKLDVFSDVLSRVQTHYVVDIDEAEAIDAAINGMLTSLDPHSAYLNPDDFKDIQVDTSGEYGGLGIEVVPEDGFVKVVAPIDDTPASRAGLKSGDLLTAIDGRQIVGLPLNDAVKEMRGAPGTDITITVLREGSDPFDVTLTREVIQPKSVTFRMEEDDIGYVRLSGFNERTTLLLEEALMELSRESVGSKPKGLVLDLRNNPGGLLDQAVSVTDMFLSGGEVVSTIGRRPSDIDRYNARSGEVFKGVPIIVLINSGSASAAEIVAGALQDRGRARVIGVTSFGKGSVQTVIPLGADRGALRLTTARYYTPAGRSIQGTGIEPDLEVAQERVTEEELARIRRFTEADLPNALENEDGTTRRGPHVPDEQPPEDYEGDDYQLERALELLRDPAKLASLTERAG